VQPFWLSDEEKWPSLELCMGGVHSRSWSSMGGHGGARQRGERRGMGGGEGGGAPWGGAAMEELGGCSSVLVRSVFAAACCA
jgi:hypothetical protein